MSYKYHKGSIGHGIPTISDGPCGRDSCEMDIKESDNYNPSIVNNTSMSTQKYKAAEVNDKTKDMEVDDPIKQS